MCGIAGALSVQYSVESLEPVVKGIVQYQHRRGPDNTAVERIHNSSCSLVLGHNRLSIIDLSAAAHQPMWDITKQFAIVFNGEIYNYLEICEELLSLGHRFATQSDTEVILEAFKCWGTDALNRFNGMFAFALFDKEKQRVWLVRDRFGVKPLYFAEHQGVFVFASMPGSIAKHFGFGPCLKYLGKGIQYLIYEDDSEDTPYQNIRSLRPGHFLELEWQNGQVKYHVKEYYNLAQRVLQHSDAIQSLGDEQQIELIRQTLINSVILRLRSDVPVAISLSGGLDSAIVAAIASQKHPNIAGFSFAHPDAPESEGPLVHKLQEKIGVDVHYSWPNLTSATLIELFEQTLQAQDAAFPTTSIMAQNLVYKAAKERGFKVLLGGQGGDEGFMGYKKFQLFFLRQLFQQRKYAEALPSLLHFAQMLLSEFGQTRLYFNNLKRYTKQQQGLLVIQGLPSQQLNLNAQANEPLWQRQARDIQRFSLPTLLRYEDRNSMFHSIESRLPFMDYRVLEMGLALPTTIKLRDGYGKWVLRKAFQKQLPIAIHAARNKRGFDVRQNWIDKGLGEHIRSTIRERKSQIKHVDLVSNADQLLSNEVLKSHPTALREALGLIWLTNQA